MRRMPLTLDGRQRTTLTTISRLIPAPRWGLPLLRRRWRRASLPGGSAPCAFAPTERRACARSFSPQIPSADNRVTRQPCNLVISVGRDFARTTGLHKPLATEAGLRRRDCLEQLFKIATRHTRVPSQGAPGVLTQGFTRTPASLFLVYTKHGMIMPAILFLGGLFLFQIPSPKNG